MSRSASVCGIILAAGESMRMGTDKALLPWPPEGATSSPSGETFLSAAIQSLSPFSEMVIVVAGRNQPNVAPIAYANGASVVVNPAPERGQFSSLQVGLQEVLNHGRDAAIVTLVDRPPASVETLQVLTSTVTTEPVEIWAVVPEYNGKHGHPFIAGREMIEAFLKAPATATARDIEHQCAHHIRYVAVSDAAVTLNVDTPQDYAALSS